MDSDKINDNKNIIGKLTFKKLFFMFIIFSFIGCIYEDIYFVIKRLIKYGIFKYTTKRGLLYFELAPIYGFGACLMIFLLTRKKHKKSSYFWLGALIGGAFEYFVSVFQEFFTGTVSWDYSNYFLNIGGRTTIPYMIFWGGACYLLMNFLYPYFSRKIDEIPKKTGNIIYKVLLVVISLDIFLSYTACIRFGLRNRGIPPKTFYGEFLDKYYYDERMRKSYTNLMDR